MPSLVQFDTAKFDFANEPPNPINPILGESVLRWLKAELNSAYEVGEIFAEDWGWCCDIMEENDHYFVGASAEANGDGSFHVMIQVHQHRPLLAKLLRRKVPPNLLAGDIAETAREDPAIRNVQLEDSG